MSNLEEKKKFKKIRFLSSSSDEEESSGSVQSTSPGREISEKSYPETKRKPPFSLICSLNLSSNVLAAIHSAHIVDLPNNKPVVDCADQTNSNGLLTSIAHGCLQTKLYIAQEFLPDIEMFKNFSEFTDAQIQQMHYYLQSMLKEKKRQEEDVTEFEILKTKLQLLGENTSDREIIQLKKEFKKKAKVMGAKFIKHLRKAMCEFNDKNSYLAVLFIKIMEVYGINNIPNRKSIIKCRIAIQGMLELNGCKEYNIKYFFIFMGEKTFLRIVERAWSMRRLANGTPRQRDSDVNRQV